VSAHATTFTVTRAAGASVNHSVTAMWRTWRSDISDDPVLPVNVIWRGRFLLFWLPARELRLGSQIPAHAIERRLVSAFSLEEVQARHRDHVQTS
jgi:hypothetical protein